jgi:hypothetical protein
MIRTIFNGRNRLKVCFVVRNSSNTLFHHRYLQIFSMMLIENLDLRIMRTRSGKNKILCYVRGFYLPFRHRCSRDSFIFTILGRFGKKIITTASRKCEHGLVNSDRSFMQSPKVRVQFLSLLFLYMRMWTQFPFVFIASNKSEIQYSTLMTTLRFVPNSSW